MKEIILANGVKMPQIGYGVYQVSKEECKRCVLDALKVGYRHIDTAQSYFNEEEVGDAISESGIDRKDIFLTTKVWIEHYGYEECYKSILTSLAKLKTIYLDLVLLHQPFGDYHGAYKALEDLYAQGKIRAIGVSNFYPDRFVDLASWARIKPMVNQIETNPYNQRIEDQEWLKKYQCAHEAWAPFGEGRSNMFNDATLMAIASKHHKSTAQIILRWLIQRDIIVIPKSTHIERMKENFDVFDFELSEEEMTFIKGLDTKTSLFFSHQDPKMVERFYQLIEERKNR